MITVQPRPLARWRDLPMKIGHIAVWWLGQAGFLFRTTDHAWIIDPYLSDSLEVKYRDAYFPHKRMSPIPIEPSEITGLQWILATHKHTDHMDPGTLPSLVSANPDAEIIAPLAAKERLTSILDAAPRLVRLLRRDDELKLSNNIKLTALPSAHEEFEQNPDGADAYLGYVLTVGGITIYHSGDCVPYAGLSNRLKQLNVQVAMLPVNGRDVERRAHGVPGNFTFAEAAELCRQANIPTLIAHHFEMFAFNTVDRRTLKNEIARLPGDIKVHLPRIDQAMFIDPR